MPSPRSVEGTVVAPPGQGAAGPLPCLSSNNAADLEIIQDFSDTSEPFEILSEDTEKYQFFSPYHKKQALCLFENTDRFISSVGIDQVGFLTLTFADNVTDHHEARRRFCSLRKHLLATTFGEWMLVKERQRRGAWHYHLLIDCWADIRTGFDWDAFDQCDYSSATPHLRSLWRLLRERLPVYGFGRSELLPIRSNIEAMSRYIGKYISKHIGSRKEEDKGVRLTSYSSKQVRSTPKFSWNTDNAQEWRRKVKVFALAVARCDDLDELRDKYGPRWCYHLAASILTVEEDLDRWAGSSPPF